MKKQPKLRKSNRNKGQPIETNEKAIDSHEKQQKPMKKQPKPRKSNKNT